MVCRAVLSLCFDGRKHIQLAEGMTFKTLRWTHCSRMPATLRGTRLRHQAPRKSYMLCVTALTLRRNIEQTITNEKKYSYTALLQCSAMTALHSKLCMALQLCKTHLPHLILPLWQKFSDSSDPVRFLSAEEVPKAGEDIANVRHEVSNAGPW